MATRWDGDPRQSAVALRVAGVEQEGLVEAVDEVRAAAEQLVVHGDRADDTAGAAAARLAQAEQADHVGEVAVVGDVPGRAVAAHERVGRVLAGVDDVAE